MNAIDDRSKSDYSPPKVLPQTAYLVLHFGDKFYLRINTDIWAFWLQHPVFEWISK